MKTSFAIWILLPLGLLASAWVSADARMCKSKFLNSEFYEAVDFCREASINGVPAAKYYLSLMYLEGKGLKRSESLGLRLLKESAQLGNVDALKKLAKGYQGGALVGEKDMSKACDWWERLANLGEVLGQERIGVCYVTGKGRQKDMSLGYAYLSLASSNGNAAAKYIIDTYGDRFPASAKQEAAELVKQIQGK